MPVQKARTRIQQKNIRTILEAALDVFSRHGFRGATLDQIAQAASLSKPNLLYYFPSKEAIHMELLGGLLDSWLDPLRALNDHGDPVDEIIGYALRKLDMARDLPRESRLFANELLQGAPRFLIKIEGPLKTLVDEKAALIRGWSKTGRIAPVDPYHLIFSIWAVTQHYADFDVQVRSILDARDDMHFADAAAFLTQMYLSTLTPR